jgi:hypothetical protein
MSSGLEMATEKVFKIGLFMSTLSILGAPTLNMMMATFMMGQATTFQDASILPLILDSTLQRLFLVLDKHEKFFSHFVALFKISSFI